MRQIVVDDKPDSGAAAVEVRHHPPALVHLQRSLAGEHAPVQVAAERSRREVQIAGVIGSLEHPDEEQGGSRTTAQQAGPAAFPASRPWRQPVRDDVGGTQPGLEQPRLSGRVAEVQERERDP